jgi:hypothetical protein
VYPGGLTAISNIHPNTAINDRLKQARLALNLSQRAFSQGIFLKSPGYYGDMKKEAVPKPMSVLEQPQAMEIYAIKTEDAPEIPGSLRFTVIFQIW